MKRRKGSSYPGQYLARESFVHRTPAAGKLAVSMAISLIALFAGTATGTAMLALVCVALYAAARLGARALMQDGLLVAWQAPLVLAVYLILNGPRGLSPALLVTARLAVFTLPSLWLQRTTSSAKLTAALGRLLPERLAFLLAMSLRFVPLVARDARDIYWLQRQRGARLSPRELLYPMNWSEACHCLVVPLLIRSFHRADQVAVAARQRGVGETVAAPHA